MTTPAELTAHEQGLLAAVLAEPDQDATRLIYADFLEERQGKGDAERAEFIRVQCELAQHFDEYEHAPRAEGLHQRERELLDTNTFADFPAYVRDWWFQRGFVHRVCCDALDFLQNMTVLFAVHPLQEATLLWPGVLDGLQLRITQELIYRHHTAQVWKVQWLQYTSHPMGFPSRRAFQFAITDEQRRVLHWTHQACHHLCKGLMDAVYAGHLPERDPDYLSPATREQQRLEKQAFRQTYQDMLRSLVSSWTGSPKNL